MAPKANNLTSFPHREKKYLHEWEKYNRPENYDHPEFGILPVNAPCDSCVEVLEKRTVDERYFVNVFDNQVFYKQKALGDLHQFLNGKWVSIEPELHPVSGTRYESGYVVDQPVIDFSLAKTELRTANGTLQFNNWKLIVIQNGMESNQFAANWSDYTVGSDGALIHNVFPGIDAEMIVQKGSIKTSFIVRSNEFGVFDKLVFREELSGLPALHAQFSDGTHTRGIGSLKLMSGSNELAVMDEAKLFAKDGPKDLSRSAEYDIHSNRIDLIVDYDWINENIGSYQLIVDPLVTGTATLAQASITGSRYNGSCDFTNSCDYNLTVSTPANATITDMTFSFTYSANGTTCWLQDGGMRIGLGSCVSPSAAGYYWFCNGIGGGTCSATNQTVFSDLSACSPAPSCTPQNAVFTLKFYRSCWGATGCSNTCIGAASPWVMNIIGKTLEYTNVANPITLSATTVCQGGSLTASTSGTGGVPGYTYNWSFNASGSPSVGTGASASISFPTSGTITLYSIVTDACGNQITNSRTVTVTPGTPPTITAGGPTTFCAGGSVTLTSSSTTGNTWSTGATTQSITVSASGSYTVTVSNGSCSSTSAATVVTVNPVPATPTITAGGPTTFCAGGSVTLTSSSATGNTWSTGATTQTITVSASGTYSVIVSASGCTSSSASTTVTVNPLPAAPVIAAGGPTTFCAGGSVTLTSSSATGNTWSTGETTQSITVTTSGSYTVTFTDANTCSATSAPIAVTVNPVPAVPTISASGPTSFCTGGSVTLTSSSATGNTWSTGATSQSITVSASGSYTVTVSNGSCSSTSVATVVTVNPIPATPTITAGGPTTFCAGGSVTLTSSSTTGNTWSTGETTQSITVTASGSYTVTVSNGSCSSTSTATVVTVDPIPATPTITAGGPTTFCAGGSVTLTSSSATGNTWSTGATTQSITVSASGSYTVTVSNGSCSSTSAATVVTVNPVPATPTITAGGPTTFCAGGSVTLTSSSATGNTWSSGETTQSITVSASGSYTVTVSNGSCSSTSAATVVTVDPIPATPSITAGGSATFCAGGSVTLTSSSATGNTWSTGATTQSITVSASGSYTVTVSNGSCSSTSAATVVTVDPVPATPTITAGGPTTFCTGGSVTLTSSSATGNTWSSGETTQSITVTASGSYTVTVSNGSCSSTSAATLVTVDPIPATPTITAGGPTTFCAGGSVTLTSSAATGNTWSTGATTQSITVSTSGTYSLTVSASGCTSASASSTVTVNPVPAVPTITAGGPTTFCAGGSVTLTSSSATGNTWSTGETTQSITVTNSGSYTVTVSSGSCSSTSAATTVTVNPVPPVPTITANGPTTFCAGGSVTLTSSAASGNTWSTGAISQSVTISTSGSYTVTVSSLGCSSVSAPTNITVNPIPTVTASNNGPLCVNQTLNLTATGTGGGTYSWSGPNSFTSTAQNPSIASVTGNDFGVYTVTVTVNSCTATASTNVVMNSGTSTAIIAAGPFCANDAPFTLLAASPGGNWSGTGIVDASTGLFDPGVSGAGSFVITYDIPGSCSGASTTTIIVNPVPSTDFSTDTLSGCAPLKVHFTNSTPSAVSSQWNFGNGETASSLISDSATYTSEGCYTVTLTVTDNNGCSASSVKVNFICVSPDADASFIPSPYDATITHPEIHFINTSANATDYLWSFGQGGSSTEFSPTYSYDEIPSNYTVQLIATNAFGCSDTARVVVRILDELVYYMPNTFTPNGDEHNNTFQPVFTSGFDPFSFTLLIFNRWGEVVFESKDAKAGWDGTYNGVLVQEGIYTWAVTFKDPNTDKKYRANGHVTLIR